VKVSVAEASNTAVTLAATISAEGRSVTSGMVEFLRNKDPIGRSPVDSKGYATLHVIDFELVRLIEDSISQTTFVADRNAGIWKPVTLYVTGEVKISDALVDTDLPLPTTDPATLRVYANVSNGSETTVHGKLEGDITRTGKQPIHITQSVTLAAGETKEISFDPSEFPQLIVRNPDLWWPYTLGKPALYDLHLQFVVDDQISDTNTIRFGIRKITQYRDKDEQFPSVGTGGSFYLQINGKDFLIRGAAYTPDLLYRYDPNREAAEIG
jgi:exo-1,4-beta-D-glucosaminidase